MLRDFLDDTIFTIRMFWDNKILFVALLFIILIVLMLGGGVWVVAVFIDRFIDAFTNLDRRL
jgi:hypothetical protein